MTIVQSDGFTVPITGWTGAPSSVGQASVIMPNGQPAYIDAKGNPMGALNPNAWSSVGANPQKGKVTGGITGINILINIQWLDMNPKVASTNGYGGKIDDNGIASGTGDNTQNNAHFSWHINEPFVCGPASDVVGFPSGPNTCVSGLVWRAARPGDAVCVTPSDRDRTVGENAAAASNVDPQAGSGPQGCIEGLVWRQAFDGDTVCVTPDTRRENLDWNNYPCGTVISVQETSVCPPQPPPPNDLRRPIAGGSARPPILTPPK
jgi:hypothetical protein